jgi:hypothetical protein
MVIAVATMIRSAGSIAFESAFVSRGRVFDIPNWNVKTSWEMRADFALHP